jgi:hypothetical protein
VTRPRRQNFSLGMFGKSENFKSGKGKSEGKDEKKDVRKKR